MKFTEANHANDVSELDNPVTGQIYWCSCDPSRKNRLRSLMLWCLLSQTPSGRRANLRVWKRSRRTWRWNWKLSCVFCSASWFLWLPADRRRRLKIRTKTEKKQTGCRSIHYVMSVRGWNGWTYWTEEMMQSGRKIREQKIYYEYGTCKMVTGVTKRQPCVCVCDTLLWADGNLENWERNNR